MQSLQRTNFKEAQEAMRNYSMIESSNRTEDETEVKLAVLSSYLQSSLSSVVQESRSQDMIEDSNSDSKQ